MSLTADSIVRQGSGGAATSSTSTAIVVPLDSGSTDADSVLFVGLFGEGLTFATPSGWAVVGTPANGLSVYRRGPVEGLAAGESSWNFTPSATAGKAVKGAVLDLTGVDPDTTVDVVTTVAATTTGTTASTGLTTVTSTFDGLAVAIHAVRSSVSATVDSWSGQTNGFEEVLEAGQAGTGNSVDVAVSVFPAQEIDFYVSVATCSRTLTSASPAAAMAFVINAAGARKASDLHHIDGAEHGLITGNTLVSGASVLSSVTGSPSVSATAARSGGFGWLFSSTAATCAISFPSISLTTLGDQPTFRRAFRFPTLPAADLAFWAFTGTGLPTLTFTFRVATGKIGAAMTGGTGEQVSDQAVTAGQWFAIDYRQDMSDRAAGNAQVAWQIDYNAGLTDTVGPVSQTPATRTGSPFTPANTTQRVGWTAAATADMWSDDAAAAPGYNYPIGDLRVLPLKAEATIAVTGATTNFGVMTANGTIAAWNAANALAAIDDVPPDLSGTRDALVCLLPSDGTTTYVDVPVEPYDLAANQVNVRGVAFACSLYATTATTSTIKIQVTDGTDVYPVYAEADAGADNAATPVWIAKIVRPASGRLDWTQARVNGLAVRISSADPNPDIGPDMVVASLAVVKAQAEALFGEAGEPVYVEAHRDPNTQALVGATVTTDADNAVELTWEVDGVPDSSGSIPPSTTAQYVPMSPDGGIETVGTVSLIPG